MEQEQQNKSPQQGEPQPDAPQSESQPDALQIEPQSSAPQSESQSGAPQSESQPDAPQNALQQGKPQQPLPHCRLVIRFGEELLNTLVFDQDIITIGRDPECDVSIDNLGASRVHAKVTRMGIVYRVEDQGSKTGTFIRGKKITGYNLNDKDEIFLAKHTITFSCVAPGSAKVTPANAKATRTKTTKTTKKPKKPQLMNTMEVDFRNMAKKHGTAPASIKIGGRSIPLYKTVTFLGKSHNCDITVEGFLVGERHALIAREEKGFFIHHLGMFKPPRVNQKPVELAKLQNGDMVQVGTLQFIFEIPKET